LVKWVPTGFSGRKATEGSLLPYWIFSPTNDCAGYFFLCYVSVTSRLMECYPFGQDGEYIAAFKPERLFTMAIFNHVEFTGSSTVFLAYPQFSYQIFTNFKSLAP